MTAFQKLLTTLLRVQSVISVPHSLILPRRKRRVTSSADGYIFGQDFLNGRLYLAKESLTACESAAVHNALIYFGRGQTFGAVKREFFRRGALTLWLVGFFGGNPYSITRVLRSFGIAFETVAAGEMSRDGAYIISFFNGRHPSLHTVFCTRENGRWMSYNMHGGDRRPMPFDPSKLENSFIIGYRLESSAS